MGIKISTDTLTNRKPCMRTFYLYVEREIRNILEDYQLRIAKLPSLIRIQLEEGSNKLGIIGDTHGDFKSLSAALDKLSGDFPKVVLGDVVDRGDEGLKNILYIVELSLIGYPLHYIRGNHESRFMNMKYGFYNELRKLQLTRLFPSLLRVFSSLPYACVVNGKLLCVHGGIPKSPISLDSLEKLPRGKEDPWDKTVIELLWNDFEDDVEEWGYNNRGPGCYVIGGEVLRRFLKQNNLNLVIRGHEMPKNGVSYHFSKRLITVSSFNSAQSNAKALIVKMHQNNTDYAFEEICLS